VERAGEAGFYVVGTHKALLRLLGEWAGNGAGRQRLPVAWRDMIGVEPEVRVSLRHQSRITGARV